MAHCRLGALKPYGRGRGALQAGENVLVKCEGGSAMDGSCAESGAWSSHASLQPCSRLLGNSPTCFLSRPLRWVLYTDLVGSTVANCMMRPAPTLLPAASCGFMLAPVPSVLPAVAAGTVSAVDHKWLQPWPCTAVLGNASCQISSSSHLGRPFSSYCGWTKILHHLYILICSKRSKPCPPFST